MVELDLLDAIGPALLDGEQVVWAARPDPLPFVYRGDRVGSAAWLIVVALMVAMAAFCVVAIVTGQADSHVVIRLFVLVPLVLYAFVGQQMRVRRRLRRTIYALTDSRLLILTLDKAGVRTYAPRLDLLPLVTYVRRGGVRGDIVLGENKGWAGRVASRGIPTKRHRRDGDRSAGLYDLADVDTPLRIIRERHPNVRERRG